MPEDRPPRRKIPMSHIDQGSSSNPAITAQPGRQFDQEGRRKNETQGRRYAQPRKGQYGPRSYGRHSEQQRPGKDRKIPGVGRHQDRRNQAADRGRTNPPPVWSPDDDPCPQARCDNHGKSNKVCMQICKERRPERILSDGVRWHNP